MFEIRSINQARKPAETKSERADPALDKKTASDDNSVWQSLALNSTNIQPKLAISQPDDAYEREADHLADRVMRMTTPLSSESSPSFSTHTSGRAQSKSAACNDKEEKEVQSARTGNAGIAPQTENQTQGSAGQPLDPATRAFMEPRFGYNFSRVRVHTGPAASAAAKSIQADAYTLGRDIYFAPGKYEPSTHDGLHLLAHEATHVIQQTGEHGLAETSALLQDDATSGAANNDLASGSANSHATGRSAIVSSQPSASGIIQRTITVNVLAAQLTPSDAQQMTPAELDSQIGLLRGHLSTLSPDSSEYAALQENLLVLEAEMRRRNAPRQTQARQRPAVTHPVPEVASVSAPANASVDPSIAAAGIVGPFISPGAPGAPLGGIPQSAFEWSRIPGEAPFTPATATAETAAVGETAVAETAVAETAALGETAAVETVALGETAVAGAETVALGETAVLGAETVAVGETVVAGAETAELLAAGGTVLATEASIPVIGWIALGVTVVALVGVGIYLGSRYLLSEERRPVRPLTPEEGQRVLPLERGVPAQLPGPEGQNITPAIDPATGEELYTPSHPHHGPGIDPTTGERLYTPGPQSSDERAEASERRGPRPPRGQQRRQHDEDYTVPDSEESVTPLQPNNPMPHYDPATGILEDPVTGVSKQTFRTPEEALENFQRHARPEEGTLEMDIGGAQPGRPTSDWIMTIRHIPVFSAIGRYIGTIFENMLGGGTFFTWGRGRH